MMLQHMYQMYIKSGDHDWILENDPLKPFGRNNKDEYNVLKCVNCGITGRVLPNGTTVYIGSQYDHAIVVDCPGLTKKSLTRTRRSGPISDKKSKPTRNKKSKLLRK